MIELVFEQGSLHPQFLELLIAGKVNLLFNAINRIVGLVVFVKKFPEVVVADLQAQDHVTMVRKLSHERVMEIHSCRVTFGLEPILVGVVAGVNLQKVKSGKFQGCIKRGCIQRPHFAEKLSIFHVQAT